MKRKTRNLVLALSSLGMVLSLYSLKSEAVILIEITKDGSCYTDGIPDHIDPETGIITCTEIQEKEDLNPMNHPGEDRP